MNSAYFVRGFRGFGVSTRLYVRRMFDVLDDLEAVIGKIRAEGGNVDVGRIWKLAEQLDCERLRAVGGFDRSGAWAAENFRTAASALRDKTRCSDGRSYRAVRLPPRPGNPARTPAR